MSVFRTVVIMKVVGEPVLLLKNRKYGRVPH